MKTEKNESIGAFHTFYFSEMLHRIRVFAPAFFSEILRESLRISEK